MTDNWAEQMQKSNEDSTSFMIQSFLQFPKTFQSSDRFGSYVVHVGNTEYPVNPDVSYLHPPTFALRFWTMSPTKYILGTLEDSRLFVASNANADLHSDIVKFLKDIPEIRLGEIYGGGNFQVSSKKKIANVYGKSISFGAADHNHMASVLTLLGYNTTISSFGWSE